MPPSAGACQTTDADVKPDCGRAALRSSIITAIGRRTAISGGTRTPSSGAGTSTGVGSGVGVGAALGGGVADGDVDAVAAEVRDATAPVVGAAPACGETR